MIKQQGILPQQGALGRIVDRSALVCLLVITGLIGACSSVSINQPKPDTPVTPDEARRYLEKLPAQRQMVEYELNKKERDCYQRFFVSDCVDNVRTVRNDYMRAFLIAETKAAEIIRLERYQRRQMEKRTIDRTISPL